MARKSAKTPTIPPVATTLAISELRIRLEFLERDRQKLLAKIEKKRSELNNFLDRIRELSVEISQRSAPVFQKLLELDRQIHAAFAEIFTGRKLGKQTRKDIEGIYRSLQAAGLISPNPDRENTPPRGFFDDDEDYQAPDWEWNERESSTRFEPEPPKLDRDELKKIRQLFLKLAEVFHPDKVTDPEHEKYHTEVMQEINQAYQSGDLAKLLAIEQKHQMGEIVDCNSEDDLLQRCARLERENEVLNSQFENLKSELRSAKNTEAGAMVSEHRKLSKAGVDPISEAIAETEEQLQTIDEVCQFVLDFRDRRMTIKDFLKGPAVLQQMHQISEVDLLMELLGL